MASFIENMDQGHDRVIIAGLGNPGEHYRQTRHNIGFRVLCTIAMRHLIRFDTETSECRCGFGYLHEQPVVLAKPLSYMNRSGITLLRLARQLEIPIGALIVIHDDLDLEFGRIKIKQKGGDGGHNGIKSILDAFEDDRFFRIRIGIGRPGESDDVIQHVLSPFNATESALLGDFFAYVSDAVETLLCAGAKEAMQRFNGKGVLTSR